jgi:hypothetical protein
MDSTDTKSGATPFASIEAFVEPQPQKVGSSVAFGWPDRP